MRAWPRVVAALLVVAALFAAACTSPSPSPPPPTAGLTIYGAASLRMALGKLEPAWESAHPDMPLTMSTGSSAALRAQIELGAPADVFLAADIVNPRRLVQGGFADGDAVPLAAADLAIVTPIDNPGRVTEIADLARPGLKIIAAGPSVPISGYVDELLRRPGLPPGFAGAYRANIVSREDDVAAVLAKVQLGEGDAGIVYYPDAVAAERVDTISMPRDLAVRATYAGVVVKASRDPVRARAFLEWLTGPEARRILANLGFDPPGDG